MVFIQQFLTAGAKTQERLIGCSGQGLLPWPSCPALSQTQTAELTPRASGLWISDLTALLAFPSIISLSLFHCSPLDLLLSSDSVSVTLLRAACSLSLLVLEVASSAPGMPPTPAWGAPPLNTGMPG
jgi:hypothetical protein